MHHRPQYLATISTLACALLLSAACSQPTGNVKQDNSNATHEDAERRPIEPLSTSPLTFTLDSNAYKKATFVAYIDPRNPGDSWNITATLVWNNGTSKFQIASFTESTTRVHSKTVTLPASYAADADVVIDVKKNSATVNTYKRFVPSADNSVGVSHDSFGLISEDPIIRSAFPTPIGFTVRFSA